MSFSSSPASPSPQPGEAMTEEFPEGRVRRLDARVVRSLLAGALGVAVIGGGAASFLWLSSAPSGAEAVSPYAGGVVTPPVATSSPDGAAVAFAAGGRDIFAGTAMPTAASDPLLGVEEVASSSTSGGTAVASASSRSTTVASVVPSRGASSGTTTTTTAPVTSAPTTTGSAPEPSVSATPSGTRSTAPGWTVPRVSFVTGTDAYGIFRIAGEDVRIAEGSLVYPLGIRYGGLVGEATAPAEGEVPAVKAVFTAENDARTGWVITSDPEGEVLLPDAVVGHPQGRVRAYGVLGKQTWIRIDREPGELYSEGAVVEGTGLTFLGSAPDVEDLPAAGTYFKDTAGNIYFGTFGGGESDGVSF
ncbi:hypothetical protein MO973_29880 [Paenibacillus sp. TRM 82003]|uniref:hypothetical protein n=1 Tax=Kineococcus sp. TRM81007 TaxID=2925831 RepID=UPI001F5A5FAD|nr:hypothetical protein [Kineococcus sp. TRM81007]MCI2239013.1 hypothetical protein [Kineococcus sp. TRM81007]MCI3924433.1 hypothetical protein [Paenibacillus sp. TRM 82003]